MTCQSALAGAFRECGVLDVSLAWRLPARDGPRDYRHATCTYVQGMHVSVLHIFYCVNVLDGPAHPRHMHMCIVGQLVLV
jgi:hypothetical protein